MKKKNFVNKKLNGNKKKRTRTNERKITSFNRKKKAPKVDVTADISSNESGSDYEFECSDVSDDEENPIGKSGTRKKESKAESRQKEDEDITELKKKRG